MALLSIGTQTFLARRSPANSWRGVLCEVTKGGHNDSILHCVAFRLAHCKPRRKRASADFDLKRFALCITSSTE